MTPAAGLGLKPQHYAEALASRAAGLWFEVHPENYMCEGGPRLAWLEAIRAEHPLSLHGVGLSLAGDESPDPGHLRSLKQLIDRFEPVLVSEHLAWSRRGGVYHPDLLPFPRTRAALRRIADNVSQTQDVLGRRILIENPSLYLALRGHELSEVDFLVELCAVAGCGLLLDVNNVHVSSHNLGQSAEQYLDAIPGDIVGEIHLAGHSPDAHANSQLLIDTHGEPVSGEVWRLFQRLIARIGARPTLIERDDNIPAYDELDCERARASEALARNAAPARESALV